MIECLLECQKKEKRMNRNLIRSFKAIIIALAINLNLGVLKPSQAEEVYINNRCQPNQNLSGDDRFIIFYKSAFQTQGKSYWFYAGRYQDGGVIFCISQTRFKKSRPLNELKSIQFNFIDNITKDQRNKTAFIIVTREGNGSYVPMNEYRLNFANVNKPKLTKLRTQKSKD